FKRKEARMRKLSLCVMLFLPISLIVFSGQVNGSDFSLGARYKTSNINIVEGAMFNNYWITHFELNAEWESSGIKLFANPYTYFKTVKPSDYVEGGLLIGVKKNIIDIFDLTAKSLFFGWEEEGKWNRGFVLFGELEFNIFLNPRVVYAFGNIIDREDLSGSSIRLDFGGRIGTIRYKGKKVCVVESRRGLIYNHHFFRDQKGFIFTADVLLKELKIFGPFMTELFINWFYAKGIINRIMVGINIDLQILGKEG
ncbi:MAG: hypothetical protein KAU24_01550, partial [Candidatus Aenigmarchaeota archaeon]|nr:hypothetical protein [Candidatus Aenigmarchaeota archaeon]